MNPVIKSLSPDTLSLVIADYDKWLGEPLPENDTVQSAADRFQMKSLIYEYLKKLEKPIDNDIIRILKKYITRNDLKALKFVNRYNHNKLQLLLHD